MPSPPPPKESSRSRSPRRDRDRNRSRSRSPPRKPKASSSGGGGFKWKDKSSNRDDDRDSRRGGGDDYVSSRYKRERSPRRDKGFRDRDGGRGENSYRPGRDRFNDDRRENGRGRGSGGAAGGRFNDRDSGRDRGERRPQATRGQEKPKTTAPAAPAGGNQEFIIVTVNDRLGTKAQIPCLASDPVKLFKAQVAARIGRQPHEIMLKRQGERPFKDQLTLEDYGVSNGVQLDLELDTGD